LSDGQSRFHSLASQLGASRQERLAARHRARAAGARRFLLTAATIAAWMRRLDEQGPDALVQTPTPVNRFDEHVTLLVHQLHQAAPHLGRRGKAEFQNEYRDWCERNNVKPRFGAVGKHGSMLHVSHCTPFVLSDATSAIG
jgi:hypothetical protein